MTYHPPPPFWCVRHDAQRHDLTLDNWLAKATQEVTCRVEVPVEALMTGTPSVVSLTVLYFRRAGETRLNRGNRPTTTAFLGHLKSRNFADTTLAGPQGCPS